jgi:predicted TIM-barrel fold metal-dependent hydrolase
MALSTTSRRAWLLSLPSMSPNFCQARRFDNSQFLSDKSASKLSRPLPKGAWDSHMHVVDPVRFPLAVDAQYKPHPHTIKDAKNFYSDLGIRNMVFVQPSIYGDDNSCMLEALEHVTPKHGRAVVQFDPETIDNKTMEKWHAIGVRGVRVNLVSVGRELSDEELRKELQSYAEVLKPFNWVMELYIPLKLALPMANIVPELGIKVCIDHFASPVLPKPYDTTRTIHPYDMKGFASLINLLQGGRTWVKMSAPYRLSRDPEMRDLDAIGKELIIKGSKRVVYATDWPHTRFENIDSVPFIEKCIEWCGNDGNLINRLFRDNAEELWDID